MEYIICSVCNCVYGGNTNLSAILDKWIWKNNKWTCPKHKVEDGSR